MHTSAAILSEFWIRGEHMHNGLYARKSLVGQEICPECDGCGMGEEICNGNEVERLDACSVCDGTGLISSPTPIDKAVKWYLHASFNDLIELVLSNPIDWSKPLEDVTKQIIAIKAASY